MVNSTDPPVLSTRRPSGRRHVRRRIALLLLLGPLASLLVLIVPPAPAGAARLPDSRCGGGDLASGICVGDPRGGVHWLGTRTGYDGVEIYCIDYLYATRWGVEHRRTRVPGSLRTSVGRTVAPATVAALTYLVTRYPAGRVSDTTAAAVSLIIREAMGDVRRGGQQLIPGGLTVGGQVRDVAFVPDSVVVWARVLWAEARVQRGPWTLRATLERGPDRVVTPGEKIDLVVRARNGSGGLQDATVRLGYRSFTGPAAVRLGKDGAARVQVTAPQRPTTGSVSARIDSAPAAHPVVIVPTNWSVNRHPGQASAVTQRGLVGRGEPVVTRVAATATVVRFSPSVRTKASAQRVLPGATIHDTVVVAGTRGVASAVRWSLLGPVGPEPDGRCPGVGAAAWRSAKSIVSGSVRTPGDGTYRTPGFVVRRADVGCLTYTARLAATPTTAAVSSPPGIAAETVLVVRPKSRPCVRTVASRQHGLVGKQLFDTVSVGCISGPDRVTVTWVARGPIAPLTTGSSGCDRIPAATWRTGPVRARGSFVAARAGTYRTTAFTVTRPGCYTFSESVAPTATTWGTSTPPGIAAESALFTRPPVPQVPVVPTGPALLAPGDHLRSATYAGRVRIAGLGITAPVTKVGVTDEEMVIPRDAGLLGWLRASAWAEDVVGSSVIAGHATSFSGSAGALKDLARARPGSRVIWTDSQDRVHRFVVTTVQKYPRSQTLPAAVFRTDGPHVLRLITCTDRVRRSDGRVHYVNNLVVTARAVS